MTENLDQLIADVHTVLREQHLAELARKRQMAEALIQEKTQNLQTAIMEHFGSAIINALFQAEGTMEVWMRRDYHHVPFTPEQWELHQHPNLFVTLAFTYRGCRFHLTHRLSGDWDLFVARPVEHTSSPQHAIFYAAERSIPAYSRQHLLLMIDELARTEENA